MGVIRGGGWGDAPTGIVFYSLIFTAIAKIIFIILVITYK